MPLRPAPPSNSARLSASVIIPTYNRRESLQSTLTSLARQTYSALDFEVVVVDDGGSDGSEQVTQTIYAYKLTYCHQANQGSAAARNHGFHESTGELLVFIDDDITLSPEYLAALADKTLPGVVTMGVYQPFKYPGMSRFSETAGRRIESQAARATHDRDVAFTECTSNNLSVMRSDFVDAGMWRDVLGDGPTLWGDVEFGYRAWRRGFRFVRVADARLIHRDEHGRSLASATQRAYHVSRVVQSLFALHPEIREHLPMFRDKGPIAWHDDSPGLIAHKLARQLASCPPALRAMENLVRTFEARYPSPEILERLYRWIVSGYIYRGFRAGLRERDAPRAEGQWR